MTFGGYQPLIYDENRYVFKIARFLFGTFKSLNENYFNFKID